MPADTASGARTRHLALAAGTAGSLGLAVAALGVGALPRRAGVQLGWLGVDTLRAAPAARAACTVLAAAGVLLLLAAWTALRAAGARTQLGAAALWAAPLLLAPPVFSRDVYAYAAQGALVHAGVDPYTAGPDAVPGPLADSVAPQYAGAASPYGPAFLALAGRVAALTGQHVVPAVLLLRLVAVAGLLLAAWALTRLADDPGRALWLGVANPLVLLHGVGGAHNEALMAGLLVAGLAVAAGGRRTGLALGAVLVTLGALVKLPAVAGLAVLPALPLGAPRPPTARAPARGDVTTIAGAVTAAALATGAVVTLTSGLGLGWVRTAVAGVAGPSLLSPTYGLGRALQAAGVPHGLPVATGLGTVLGGAAAVALLLCAPRLGAARTLGAALIAVAALAPAVQPWYLLWGLLPLAAAGGARTRAAAAAGSAVLCLAVLPSGVPLLRGPTWGLPVLLAAAAAGLAARSARMSP